MGEDGPEEEPDSNDPQPPVVGPRPVPRVIAPPRPGQPPQPIGNEPEIEEEQPEQPEQPAPRPATPPSPSNPFGVPFGSTTRPGVVTPVPQQEQQPNRQQP